MVDRTFFKRLQTSEEVMAWFGNMDQELDEFMQAVPEGLREKLDYSVNSLESVESWLLARYPNIKAAYNEAGIFLLGAAGRYVGEVIRKKTGAKWHIELDQQENAFLGCPVLKKLTTNLNGQNYEDYDCPHSFVTASLDRRTGSFIRDTAEKYIERVGVF